MVEEAKVLAGIIGYPVGHSLSPAMHNAAFAALDLPWSYRPLPVEPGNLAPALRTFLQQGFRAFNVTIPHKEHVIPLLDETAEHAARIGAVNTISVRDGRLFGDNTDWQGFLRDLEHLGHPPDGLSALVLGSGGAARGVVYALLARGCTVVVAARNGGTLASLVDHMKGCFPDSRVSGRTLEDLPRLDRDFDLVVNTTPIGMHPKVDASPWPAELEFPRCALAYDLVYNPAETRFMQQAANAGIPAANGLGMLIYQAARAFTIWTGHEAPVDIMRQAALRGLSC
jgi:shikimate dehydrogenase